MSFAVSIVPILLYLMLIKGMDGFSLAKWVKIGECFLWGAFSCFFCFGLGELSGSSDMYALIEEMVKGLPLCVAIYRKRSVFFGETLMYGAAVGAGFSLLENVLYICLSEGFSLADAVLRGLGTSLLHMGCTALFACGCLLLARLSGNRNPVLRALAAPAALVPPAAIHYAYNLFLLPEYLQMLLVTLAFVTLFVLIFELDSRQIHHWLDLCISNDIALYTAIRRGHLQSTNAGRYLLLAKERFRADVFFDICVYLGLYLELSVAAKSRMIMKEAGFAAPAGEQAHAENLAKLAELKTLRRSIGKSGLLLLSPLVNFSAADEWVMGELL